MPKDAAATLFERIYALADDPRPHQTLKLRGEPPRWRLRIGDFRVVYTISDSQRIIYVLQVLRRSKDTYR